MLVLAGCGGNPTAQEAVQKFGNAYCTKLQQCYPTDFANAFPGGVNACVDKLVQAIPSDDRSKPDACDDSQIDTCVKDVQAMSCSSSLSASSLPNSCKNC